MRVTLLGPQRRPTLDTVAASLRLEGPIATVTAGWQEREPADAVLSGRLGSRDVNLALYRRWLEVQDRDPEFAVAQRQLQGVLDEVQDIYLLRLDHALQAVYAVQRRSGDDQLLVGELAEAVTAVRDLDAAHLRRISNVRCEFNQAWQPHDRPVIAEHCAAVARLLSDAVVLVVAGGHVGVLIDALHLFNVAASLRSPVIAWSAGPGHPEVYGSGLSVLRNIVPLPHARARLLLDDAPRMAVFARRFAPARCILLENGTRVDTDSNGTCPPGIRVLAEDGRVTSLESA